MRKMRPLAGPEYRILGMLVAGCSVRRVIEVGWYGRMWSEADVKRVIDTWLSPTPRRRSSAPANPKGKKAPKPPRTKLVLPPPTDPPREVLLPPHLAEVLERMVDGQTRQQIAIEMRVATATASNKMSLVARALGAPDREHAVAMVEAGWVVVRVGARGLSA